MEGRMDHRSPPRGSVSDAGPPREADRRLSAMYGLRPESA